MQPNNENQPSKDNGPQTADSRKCNLLLLLGIAGATLLVCILVGARTWNLGITGQWTWAYFDQPAPLLYALPAACFCLLLALVISFYLRHGITRKLDEIIAVFLCLAIAFGISHHLAEAGPLGKFQPVPVTTAPGNGGYYAEAIHAKDMGAYLAGYADTIATLKIDDRVRGHVADHPAAPILFHWLVNRTMEKASFIQKWFLPPDDINTSKLCELAENAVNLRDPERYTADPPDPNRKLRIINPPTRLSSGQFAGIWAAAFLLRLAGILALIGIYLLGRELYAKEAALLALALAALIPSLHLFSPYPDQALTFFGVWAFYAWRRAAKTKHLRWAALTAILIFLGLLWSLSFMLLVAVIGLATVLTAWRESLTPPRLHWQAWARLAGVGAAIFLTVSLLPTLLFDYDTWRVWKICLSQHATFAETFHRTYWPWLFFNPVEFAVFTGVPIAALIIAALATQTRQWWPRRKQAALPVLPWALISVLVVVGLKVQTWLPRFSRFRAQK